MKTIQLIFVIVLTITLSYQTAIAQEYAPVIEVKTAPLKNIFNTANVGVEFVLNDRIGIEPILDIGYGGFLSQGTVGMRTFGKFYVSPKYGADRFYVGAYTKLKTGQALIGGNFNKAALGFLVGYKLVTESGILLEAGYGLGRNLTPGSRFIGNNNANGLATGTGLGLDAVAQLSVGYRFGTVKEPVTMHGKLNRKLKSEKNTDKDSRRKR